MGLAQRWHRGRARINVRLIIDIEDVLDMYDAAPRSLVMPLNARVDAAYAARRDPYDDEKLVADHDAMEQRHGHHFLKLVEIAAVYQLRGWHRLRHGTVTVDAYALSEVRNILNALTVNGAGMCCEDLLDDLGDAGNLAGDPKDARAEVEWIRSRVAKNQHCSRCEHCQMLLLRDRCDAVLDANGFTDRSAWIGRATDDYDPEAVWAREAAGVPWR